MVGFSAPVTIIPSKLTQKKKWRQFRSFLGEGSATVSHARIPHHTSRGPRHHAHKKPCRARPVVLCFFASDI